ncbi:MAG: CRISPR-associated DxTHG motif protein [Deltaproteobacteria bacterium]|nr:CRISPR-associated DxTHG motif protein [Deltaproteobacteria bacterium]
MFDPNQVKAASHREPTSNHVLLTVLGKAPQEAYYSFGGKTSAAKLAPIALLNLLDKPERPDTILAICTPDAKEESYPLLWDALSKHYKVGSIDVSSSHEPRSIDEFLTKVSKAISAKGGIELTVDITHGLRHFSFLTYTAVLYLAALRNVRIRGAYYGLLQRNKPSPFFDLTPLLLLPKWFHAIQVLREIGSAHAIANLLENGPQEPASYDIAKNLKIISEMYLSGLPIELGQIIKRFRDKSSKPFKRLLQNRCHLPLSGELVDLLLETMEPFEVLDNLSGSGWKSKLSLSREELERQARLIDDLLEHGSVATALGLMDEYIVTWITWLMDPKCNWLDYYNVRIRAASWLGAIAAISKDEDLKSALTKDQVQLGEFWGLLSELRNSYHHHGMRPQSLSDRQFIANLKRALSYWHDYLHDFNEIALSIGSSANATVLVSPIGMQPGVLFSAIKTAEKASDHPITKTFVICSKDTKGFIDEAIGKANYKGKVFPLVMTDPYSDIESLEKLIKSVRKELLGVEHVFVNITGGTTLMGIAAEKIADEAKRLAIPVSRFGLVDKRIPSEQEKEPLKEGEAFWLGE